MLFIWLIKAFSSAASSSPFKSLNSKANGLPCESLNSTVRKRSLTNMAASEEDLPTTLAISSYPVLRLPSIPLNASRTSSGSARTLSVAKLPLSLPPSKPPNTPFLLQLVIVVATFFKEPLMFSAALKKLPLSSSR